MKDAHLYRLEVRMTGKLQLNGCLVLIQLHETCKLKGRFIITSIMHYGVRAFEVARFQWTGCMTGQCTQCAVKNGDLEFQPFDILIVNLAITAKSQHRR